MNKHLLAALLTLAIGVTSCTSLDGHSAYKVNENWQQYIEHDPNTWLTSTNNVDEWLVTDAAGKAKQYKDTTLPPKAFVSLLADCPYFTHLYIEGDFEVQIVGGQSKNSVYLAGAGAKNAYPIEASVKGNTLYLRQKISYSAGYKTDSMIVRIGMRDLEEIDNFSQGDIKGKNITSHGLIIQANNSGNLLLNGNMDLTRIVSSGSGTISIIGANARQLALNVLGSGTVNISGKVAVETITNYGGRVNIIGANSKHLKIKAAGNSFIGIDGKVNLQEILASDASQIYLQAVESPEISITEKDFSKVGISGKVKYLDLTLSEYARFDGSTLYGQKILAKAEDQAHATIKPVTQLFAAARDNSVIYLYQSVLKKENNAQLTEENGIILSIW